MTNDLKTEQRNYDIAVSQEAARLIRDGVAAPWTAVRLAGENVRERRQRERADRERADRESRR